MAMVQKYKHTFAEQILYLIYFSRWLKLVTHLSKASEDEILVVEVVVVLRKSGVYQLVLIGIPDAADGHLYSPTCGTHQSNICMLKGNN